MLTTDWKYKGEAVKNKFMLKLSGLQIFSLPSLFPLLEQTMVPRSGPPVWVEVVVLYVPVRPPESPELSLSRWTEGDEYRCWKRSQWATVHLLHSTESSCGLLLLPKLPSWMVCMLGQHTAALSDSSVCMRYGLNVQQAVSWNRDFGWV